MAPGTVLLRNPKLHERHIWIATLQSPPEEFLGPSDPKLETELKMSSQGRGQRVKISVELIFNSVSNFGPEQPKNSSGGIEGRNIWKTLSFQNSKRRLITFW